MRLAFKIIFAAIFLASAAFIAVFGNAFLVFGRPDIVRVNSPAIAFKGSPSGLYVVDSSRGRLFRAGGSGRVDFIAHARGGRFSEIYDLTANRSQDIFVLDTVRESGTRRIKSEAVQRYSSTGRFMGEIFRVDHEKPAFVRKIAGLAQNGDGGCSFVTLEDDRFVLHSQSPGSLGETGEKSYPFPMASKMFNFFDVDETGSVVFTTRRGEIYRTTGEGTERIFFSRPKADGGEGAIPWDVTCGDGGTFYFTDLGRRGIYAIDADGASEVFYSDPDTIYYRASAQNGLVAVSESGILTLDGGRDSVSAEFEAGGAVFASRVGMWLAIFVFLAGGVWLIVSLSRFLIKKNSLVIKLSLAIIGGMLFTAAIFCLSVTRNITARMTQEMQNRLTNVAELLAMQIPGTAFAELDSIDDLMGEQYEKVTGPLENVMLQRDEYARMYCVLYKIIDGSIAEVYESDRNHGIVNYPYGWPLEGSDEMEILSTGNPKAYTQPSWVDGGVIFALCPIYGETEEPLGLIEVGSDLAEFKRENRKLILTLFLSVISVSVTMIIVVLELMVFADGRGKMLEQAALGSPCIPVDLMRSAVFLVYFVTNITTSFLPLYARDMILTESGFPFPMEFLIAAPISADVSMGAIGSLLGDWITRKLGLRRTAIMGGLVTTAGICLETASRGIFTLTAGFAVCGFGCGIILFLAHLKIAGEKDRTEKDRGFAGIAVAMTSGINGGVVFGAFLINWLPQRAVFAVSAAVSLALLAFSVRYMTKLEFFSLRQDEEQGKTGKIGTLRFLFSPGTFLYLLALWGPAIASGYFLIYLFPIVGFDLGISESNIGYAFLLNSLVVILFSSPLTRAASSKLGKPVSLTLWTLIYAGSFVLVAFYPNIPALLLALVLMGFADSFGQSLSSSYYTELPEVVQYGYGRAIGISNVADNVFQTLGPFVFSYALHVGLSRGLLQIAAGLAALSLIFLLSSVRAKSGQ